VRKRVHAASLPESITLACAAVITRKEITRARIVPTSVTRRSMVAGLALSAAPVGIELVGTDKAYGHAKQTTPEKSLYERHWAASLPSRRSWITSVMPS
jgi:hypothetical protein